MKLKFGQVSFFVICPNGQVAKKVNVEPCYLVHVVDKAYMTRVSNVAPGPLVLVIILGFFFRWGVLIGVRDCVNFIFLCVVAQKNTAETSIAAPWLACDL